MGLPDVPGQIVYDILSRLPVKSLCRFKLVSKSWLALITDPEFVKSHLHHQSTNDNNINHKIILCSGTSPSMYSVDYQAPDHNVTELKSPGPCKYYVEIPGLLNGIVLLRMDNAEICLWNPSVKMYQKFSPPEGENGSVKYGLCHDSVSDDFRVNSRLTDGRSAVHVFTSKLNSWKRIGDFGYFIISFAEGRMGHRIGLRVVTRIYLAISLRRLFVLMLRRRNSRSQESSDVWVMKEYDVKESWIKLFVVPNVPGEFYFSHIRVLCYRKDGEVVMKLDSEKLAIYNPK
ncbi:F-box protein CPR1-like [Rhododendron vialii]|uniref:F-box protein CPR1-like n=1 Tax=Rhododendron vialii TaxID=182163 RepID=UPI00265E88BB|nr:F-box protein CPR1-like [Rhododendron vialii]